ncbi:cytochrome c, partial [Deinococcus sp.]|uniref:c-type cytochrome n=1 Tax=Deinococcus sp. TaxID=47478 RepID=UPI00286E3BF6
MPSEQRTAALWGFLFPVLTLGGIVGVLGLSGRSTTSNTSMPMTAQSAPAAPSGTTQAAPPQGSGMAPAVQAPAAQAPVAQAPAPAAQGTPVQASANGAQVYTINCVSCHGEQGAGVAGAFPAMAGNKAVLGDDKYLSNVLLYG